MKRPLTVAALALAMVATAATPAFASSSTFQMEVQYSATRLATPAGAAAEYGRIRDQVVDRCEAEHADMKFAKDYAVRFCTERTLGKAIRKIGNDNLTAVHAERR